MPIDDATTNLHHRLATAEDRLRYTEARKQLIGGANWCYWLVIFSLVNTLLRAFGSPMRLPLGLAATLHLDDLVIHAVSTPAKAVFVGVSLIIMVIFVIVGRRAHQAQRWALWTTIALVAIDTPLMLLFDTPLIFGIAIHGVILYYLVQALQGQKTLTQDFGIVPGHMPAE